MSMRKFDQSEQDEGCLVCSSLRTSPVELMNIPMFSYDPMSFSQCLKSNLWSTFVLRKLLRFPTRECEILLVKTSGLNPGEWFKMCGLCAQLIKEAVRVHQQIVMLEQQLEVLGKQVQNKMKNSLKVEKGKKRDEAGYEVYCVRNEIREYFRGQFNSKFGSSNFKRGGDSVAKSDDVETRIDDDYADPLYIPEMEYSNECGVNSGSSSRKQNVGHAASPRLRGPARRKLRYKCPLCPAVYSNVTMLRNHKLKTHKASNKNKKQELMEDETEMVEVDESHMSIQDEKFLPSSSEPETDNEPHVVSLPLPHKGNNELKLTQQKGKGERCKICNRVYLYAHSLKRHMEAHENHKSTTCTVCKYPCTSQTLLEEHINQNHGQQSSTVNESEAQPFYKCKKCDFVCSHPRHKHRHIQKHKFDDNISEGENGEVQCKLCEEIFPTRSKITIHIREKHGAEVGLRSFKCNLCQKSFHNLTYLKEHVEYRHTNKRRYYCDQCDAGFMRPFELEAHKLKHAQNVDNFVCDTCGKRCVSLRTLKVHKTTVHFTAELELRECKQETLEDN